MKYQTLLIFGAPGSGKGTQGKVLGGLPGFFHCACGDVFRALDTTTELGKAFLEYSSKGQLVPDEITIRLWKGRIKSAVDSRSYKVNTDYLVLDGIPRDISQARLMEDMIEVKKIFHLTCPDREQLLIRLKNRALKENRFDDANESVIKDRLDVYERESKPLLDYYGPELVETIDALQSPAYVMLEILKTIVSLQR